MDDILFIHHDNIAFETQNNIKFDALSSIDNYINDIILENMATRSFKAIFIKDSLSSNYIDLHGLRLAHHIRLTQKLNEKRYLPIIIISELNSHYLNRISKLSRILFTQNIKIIPNKKAFIEKEMKNIYDSSFDMNGFLETIEIEKPEQSSNHDIANEWAIYKWARFLETKSIKIEENNKKIENSLYFKYIREKFTTTDSGTKYIITENNKKGKILYIDDEWNKGWNDIIQKLLSKSKDIEFECYKGSFENKIRLINELKIFIKDSNPNVVLLDMRLTQTDHQQNINSFSGIQITKIIKKINPGIQIIILTASAKSKSLEKLHDYGVLGYIQKENPYQIQLTTMEDIQKLHKLIENGLERSYLKDVWKIQEEILGLGIFEKEELFELKNVLNKLFYILNSNIEDREIFASLELYKTIEIITRFYIQEHHYKNEQDKKKTILYWKDTYKKIDIYNSTKTKIETIMEDRLSIDYKRYEEDIKVLDCFRNYKAHGGDIKHHCKKYHIEKPTSQNLITWFKMLQKIIIQMDKLS